MSMHAAFRARALEKMRADARVEGVLLAGSAVHGGDDRFSDIDFVVVIADGDYALTMAERPAFAASLGDVMTCFTGEHVGEPRLLICLYAVPDGDGVLHVDLKFVRARDLTERVEDPAILFDRNGACADALRQGVARWPERPPQWFEDRFWVWLHYAAARLGRGERYETLSTVNWIRDQVLGPMISRRAGAPQRGLRKIETLGPAAVASLDRTAANSERAALWAALKSVQALYIDLRSDAPPATPRDEAQRRVDRYIAMLRSEKALT